MGSDIHVIVVSEVDNTVALLDHAVERVADLEAKWSRFRPDSEVCRLNASGGAPVTVSSDTVVLLEHARSAWSLSGGMFDPTLLDALRAAGYDRSFDDIDPDAAAQPTPTLRFDRPDVSDIDIESTSAGATVTFPATLGFDPGGIGKGLAADLLLVELQQLGAAGVCVNMGGDLRVAGPDPKGATWTIGIDHPSCSAPITLVGLSGGAVATSTVLKRSWTVGGQRRHHLLDPHTLGPSTSDVALASVIAGSAWQAEVLAKAALLRGVDRAFDLLDAGMAALVVDHAGNVSVSDGFERFTGGAAVATPIVFDR